MGPPEREALFLTINRCMSNLTTNRNYLSPNGFKITIDSSEFANVEYTCVSTSLPGIVLPEVAAPFRGNTNYVSGERVQYTPLDMRFIVNENLENYVELFNWIKYNASNDEMKKLDVTLNILSSHNNIAKQIRFVSAFPTSLGSIEFQTQNTDVEYVTADASLQYTYFEFVR